MKLTLISLALASSVLAAPAPAADPEAFPVSEVPSGLSFEEHAISKRQYSSSSYNQLTDGTACRPISVIYARGTGQQGNVGDSQAVGPLFFNQIASRVGGTSQLAIQGVTYSASIAGFLQGGDSAGSTTMTNLISQVCTLSINNIWVYSNILTHNTDRHPLPQHQDRSLRLQPGRPTRPQRRPAHLGRQRCARRCWYVPNIQTHSMIWLTNPQSSSSATQSVASPSALSPHLAP